MSILKKATWKIGSFWAPNFLELIPKKSLRSVLMPTDTCHVLKFRKDPFRGVDGIDSKKPTFAKQTTLPYARTILAAAK